MPPKSKVDRVFESANELLCNAEDAIDRLVQKGINAQADANDKHRHDLLNKLNSTRDELQATQNKVRRLELENARLRGYIESLCETEVINRGGMMEQAHPHVRRPLFHLPKNEVGIQTAMQAAAKPYRNF